MAEYTEFNRSKDFEYFISNYQNLFAKYGHKFIAIKNEHILGVYDSVLDAISALSDKYEVGTYIIQECTGDESAYRFSVGKII